MQTIHTIAQMSAERMLNCLVQGLLIALFAWIVLRIIGRRNSGTRFAVWFCALVAIAAKPFLQISFAGAAHVTRESAAVTLPTNWALYLFAAWATIAAVGLARVAAGLWNVRQVRKKSRVVESNELDPVLQATLAEFRASRTVDLRVSEDLHVPTAIGFFKPAVIVPAWALSELSPAELNTILLHELAHLHRWDDWTNLAQKVLRAVFFFHPAVLWVESRLSLEREMACDDLVLAQTSNPRAYAQCLVSLAEKNLILRRGMALAQSAVGRMRQTTQRVLQILDARRPSGVRVWKPAPWLIGTFSVVCLVSAGSAPKLVAFGDAGHGSESQYSSAAVSGRSVDFEPSVTPRFVPAKFVDHSKAADMTTLLQRAHKAARHLPQPAKPTLLKAENPENTQPLQASFNVVQSSAPAAAKLQASAKVVPASASTTTADKQTIAQPAVLVVVEGQQYGNAVVWEVSYWRIMIVQPNPHVVSPRTVSENPSKSI
jgi:beta-lactamase regulating signal transducer with metallopeptidase domain